MATALVCLTIMKPSTRHERLDWLERLLTEWNDRWLNDWLDRIDRYWSAGMERTMNCDCLERERMLIAKWIMNDRWFGYFEFSRYCNTVTPEINLTPLCSRVAHDVHYTRANFEKWCATHAQTLVHLKFKVHSTRTSFIYLSVITKYNLDHIMKTFFLLTGKLLCFVNSSLFI